MQGEQATLPTHVLAELRKSEVRDASRWRVVRSAGLPCDRQGPVVDDEQIRDNLSDSSVSALNLRLML
jgi:hypothetical protein